MIPPIPGLTDSQIVDIMLQWHNNFLKEALDEWERITKSAFPQTLRYRSERKIFLDNYYQEYFKSTE